MLIEERRGQDGLGFFGCEIEEEELSSVGGRVESYRGRRRSEGVIVTLREERRLGKIPSH